MKTYIAIGIVIALAIIGFVLYSGEPREEKPTSPAPVADDSPAPLPSPTPLPEITFENPKKSAHYESNTPAHGATLAGVPLEVVIDFNFDLAKPSAIQIFHDDADFGVGETIIDSNKLTMRRAMNSQAPDGLYIVKYNACWPDKSCHDGHFQFAIDRSLANNFDDQTGKKEITIQLANTQFSPQHIKVSKGTTVTWVNNDAVTHYVNTDSHPAHTYYPAQNSKALNQGERFSLTFSEAGIYPYHCSAHASTMTGNLLVE